MNGTIITQEKLAKLKKLIEDIEANNIAIKYIDNTYFVIQNFRLTYEQLKEKKELKKINKKKQKEINETIKKL